MILTPPVSGQPMADDDVIDVAMSIPPGGDVGSQLVQALEHAYNAIRREHPDVPEAVIVLSSSDSRYGHYATSRWTLRDGRELPEIMVSAEGLKRDPRDVLGTLIHEAAHGMAHARGVPDTSRQNRFHNKRFRAVAEELGLHVHEPVDSHGYTDTELPEGEHEDLVDLIAPRLIAYREFDQKQRSMSPRTREIVLRCPCGRRIRAFPTVATGGGILCCECDGLFWQPGDSLDPTPDEDQMPVMV